MTTTANCIVCGRPAAFDPMLGILARCRACGFVTWPNTPSISADALYDERYFKGVDYPDYVGNEPSLRRSMQRHLAQMAHFWTGRGALLEIGCAYGFFLDEARRDFDQITGIDIAAAAAEQARTRFSVNAHSGEFLDFPFEVEGYDVICLWDTIEHLPRPDLFMEKAARLLQPKGRLFLTTGDVSSLNARLRGANWRQIHPPSHLHYFSRSSIAALFKRTGLKVLGFETAAYYHSLHNILASLGMRPGPAAGVSRAALRTIGEPLAKRMGFWINLGDIMFVAAAPALSRP